MSDQLLGNRIEKIKRRINVIADFSNLLEQSKINAI